jgi:hypothetical protein
MQKCTTNELNFTAVNRKKVMAVFDAPNVTSDAGALVLREMDRHLGLIERLSRALTDPRRKTHIDHEQVDMLRQRVFQIACGYPDANDSDSLKSDPAFKVAVGRDPLSDDDLASQPTISRLENKVSARDLLRMGYSLVDGFIASYTTTPEAIVLDIDPTADTVYGHQQLGLFNAFEDEYCFMPFHVYEGQTGKLITTVLRPGKTPTAAEIISVLKRLVRRLRKAWPEVRIIMRADSHHTKPEVMNWLESHGVDYITGLSPNAKLATLFAETIRDAEVRYRRWGGTIRRYGAVAYAAGTWSRERRVILRVQVTEKGTDARYIVTSFEESEPKYLYETAYCGRGRMELMIKDHKGALASDRTSCHRKEANQFRLFLHSAAYVLLQTIRAQWLQGTSLAHAQFDTIRLALLKLGARVEVRTRVLRFHLPASCPYQDIFGRLMQVAVESG